jgi:hypothetical protein
MLIIGGEQATGDEVAAVSQNLWFLCEQDAACGWGS